MTLPRPSIPPTRAAQPAPATAGATDGTPSAENSQDLELVRRIRAADPAAWPALLERYQDRLYAVSLRMVGDPDAAADLAQDAMVKIIQGLGGYDGRSKLSTWMIRIAMNTCLSHLRSQRLRRHESLDARLDTGARPLRSAHTPDSARPGGPNQRPAGGGAFRSGGISERIPINAQSREPGAEESVELEERRRHVAAMLGTLPADQRAILVLRDVQGLDYEQIAAVLETAVGTVKSRLFRARAALRAALEGREGGMDRG